MLFTLRAEKPLHASPHAAENAAPPGPAAFAQFESLSAGYRHTCGIRSDGSLVCWGDNTYGQSGPFRISLPLVIR